MKLTKSKKVAFITTLSMLMSTAVVNATSAASADAVANGLADWVTIVAEILSILCLVVFAIYMGRFVTIKTGKEEQDDKVYMVYIMQ